MSNPNISSNLITTILSSLTDKLNTSIAVFDKEEKLIWANSLFNNLIQDKRNSNILFSDIFTLTLHDALMDGSIKFSSKELFKFDEILDGANNFYIIYSNNDSEKFNELKSGAHDLNNILSNIISSVALLKEKLKIPEGLNYLIKNIDSNSNRAAEIIEDLLSTDDSVKQFRRVNIASLLKEISDSFAHIKREEIQFEFKVDGELPDIISRYSDLFRIILNLLVNAQEAIKNSGIVSLSGSYRNITDSPNIPEGEYVHIQINDNGTGIKKENINKIFEEDFSTKNRSRISGIGLSFVKKRVDELKGHIIVKSELNKGTQFEILFKPFTGQTKPEKSAEQRVILIAEDELVLQDLISELLESYNYKVLTASNGREVIDVFKSKKRVDLLLIDYKMPELNGIQCIKELQKLNFNIPIILSSGSQSAAENIEINKMGVKLILKKPYEFESLLENIKSLLG